ncbi:hypothetical protein [Parabacteroides sp. FAFU027]|uniref:hypothetical protein n=1 Tax=Parabacteroides sp. FAFU027 TaxID=2922715 RepID=UPI001FAFF609|nr:hypothetical protein [Parabacteroides sp. FAFU027]
MKSESISYHNFHLKVALLALIGVGFCPVAFSQSSYSLEIQSGVVANIPLPLVIHQTNQPDFSFIAKYRTEPLEVPYYYDFRLSRWHENYSWELELIHHKIYLENPNSEITRFAISHGFNMLILNRGIDLRGNILRAGIGMVVAHPEFIIRGVEFDENRGWLGEGYVPSGLAIQMGYSQHLKITERFFVNLEAKTTFGYARLNQNEISVDTYNWAFHLNLGPGYYFLKTRR